MNIIETIVKLRRNKVAERQRRYRKENRDKVAERRRRYRKEGDYPFTPCKKWGIM